MSQQWSTPPSAGASANIPNYLVPAILSTVFCCPPAGIASIVFAAQVNSKLATGDIAGATESSDKARKFMYASVGLGLLVWVVVIVLWVFVFGVTLMSNM